MTPSPEQWREIEALYFAALELAPEDRPSFLERNCTDVQVREEVERLLAQEPTSSGFLEPPRSTAIAAFMASSDRMIGERLGDFVLEERIGSGGMGVVFRARQLGLDRRVAVKILDRSVREDPLSAERFRREAQAASRLEHPNIAAVLACGDHGDLSFYAMPLVDGWNLRELMDGAHEDGPDLGDPTVVARLMRDVADALSYSHEQGVIHRDIKPQNILVTRRRHTPRLIDFGLAKVQSFESLSRTGDVVGTPLYMSPEQIRAESGTVDHRTDVYSAGAVLYELLAGVPPFAGENVQQVLYRITHARPPSIRSRVPRVPREVETIALKALRRSPSDRYETAGDLRDDLDRFLAGGTILARPLTWSERILDLLEQPRTWKFAIPVLVVVGLLTGWLLGYRSKELPTPVGTLDVDLPAGILAATADISRIDGRTDEVTPVASGLALPIEGRELPPGQYRITVHVPHRDFSEHDRLIEDGDRIRLAPVWREDRASLEGMLRVPGGVYTTGVLGGTYFDRETERVVPTFLLDRTEVSCARYREFLDAFPEIRRPWGDAEEHDPVLDDKPVQGVLFSEALQFAEWEGKRLPTWTELQAASRGPEAYLFPWGNDPDDLDRKAIVGHPGTPWPEWVVDVDQDVGDRSWCGALHMYGNVREWTTSLVFNEPRKGEVVRIPAARKLGGNCWSTRTDRELDELDQQRPSAALENNVSAAGIRCARSLPR